MQPARITLHPGRDRSVRQGNPWLFSGAVAEMTGFMEDGQPCEVFTAGGEFLAAGYVNPNSVIICRILTRERRSFDRALILERIDHAEALRKTIIGSDTDSYRLINSEGDFLPGLIVDRYAGGFVVQILTAGMEKMRDDILAVLTERFSPAFIVERSDTAARREEGLTQRSGLVAGSLDGPLEIRENGNRYLVDMLNGQKTGFYLDQRDARLMVGGLAAGRRVLNLFSYSGGFSVAAARGGATLVTSVDSSEPALALLRDNMALNGFGDCPGETIRADVFDYLNHAESGWDLIILDPPAFATKKQAVDKAARGYKDIALRALKLLAPGGILGTWSCSHHISPVLFRQIVFAAASDAGRPVQLLAQTGHAADHPINICHKEGEYLTGIIVRVPE